MGNDKLFEKSIEKLLLVAPDDYEAMSAIQREWSKFFEAEPVLVEELYALTIQAAEALLTNSEKKPLLGRIFGRGKTLSDQHAYMLLIAASDSEFTYPQAVRQQLFSTVQTHNQRIKELVDALAKLPDRRIVAKSTRTKTGCLSDCAFALVELYRHHLFYDAASTKLSQEILDHIPQLFFAFPTRIPIFAMGQLEHHKDAVRILSEIFELHAVKIGDLSSKPFKSLSHDIMNIHGSHDDIWIKNGAKIIAPTLAKFKDKSTDVKREFIESSVLYPLNCDEVKQSDKLEELGRYIKQAQERLDKDVYISDNLMSADFQKNSDERWVKDYQRQYDFVLDHFEEWNEKRWRSAVRRLATSPARRKTLDLVISTFGADIDPRVIKLRDDADAFKNAPKKFPLSPKSNNQFKDFGFKLLVIEELMYRQKTLLPIFDLDEFSKEYTKREISREADGYEIIPEVKAYFQNLAIPTHLLDNIETLNQFTGIAELPEHIDQLYPFFDPGCGDEPIKVTPKAIEDLELLPKLQHIRGLENSKPGPKLLKALAAKNIKLTPEEE